MLKTILLDICLFNCLRDLAMVLCQLVKLKCMGGGELVMTMSEHD